ncbi:rhomboid family intramembrane serine protease [Fulvivirga sp. M361]|uniref:rhomboid family intramembrane serine protease n=1 Tax=Fulvivirga sp. M361 TaxID=2594266 RepID=UPI00117B125F|nr:rhomboid family intramembrane serine protease [Fulvivirga sp. M361]TRX49826.1 rhomboid family intramembrane serine protease [Fulvivirga sp. M361]
MVRLSPVVRNILIANVIVFILQQVMSGVNFTMMMSLWKFGSDNFAPYQFFTYMFAHGGFGHILFNMLGLIFLGPLLEQFWGPKKFLIFYLVTGIGAGILYNGIEYVQVSKVKSEVEAYIAAPDPEAFNRLIANNDNGLNPEIYEFIDRYAENPDNEQVRLRSVQFARQLLDIKLNYGSMLGASGAIYGILMAFGLLFPNTELMLLIPPIPIKAKYLVLILGGIALYSGFNRSPDDMTAHFAHLGGMIFAFIMIKIWQKGRDSFY